LHQEVITHHQPQDTTQKILWAIRWAQEPLFFMRRYHPEEWDALILISGNPGIEDETERANRRIADAELADSIERLGMQAFLEFWQETPLIRSQKHITDNLRASMQANRLKNTSIGLAKSLRQFGQGDAPNLWPELGKLTVPVPSDNWRKRHEIYKHRSAHAGCLATRFACHYTRCISHGSP
jgi:2-succinyl-6-hydroxy-2,4-cyclohexadiene-1-carboxylate synthase